MDYNDCNYRVIIIIRQQYDTHKLAPAGASHQWPPHPDDSCTGGDHGTSVHHCSGHPATCALFSQILPNIQLKSHLAVTVAKNISTEN